MITKKRALCPRHGRSSARKTLFEWVRAGSGVSVMCSQCIINISLVRARTVEILAVRGFKVTEVRSERCRAVGQSIDGSKVLASLHR